MSYQISEVIPDEVVEPYDWSTRYEINYPLYGLDAPPKDECKGKVGKAKKDCEAMKAATVDVMKPPESFLSRHKWKIVGGVAGLAAIGGLVWFLRRR